MTVRSSVLVSGMIVAGLALVAGSARAQARGEGHGESEYPVSYVERPLTLPKFALSPFLELDISRIPVTSATGLVLSDLVLAGMQVGASFGITKDLEVGAVVLPIQFNNGAGYGGLFIGEEGIAGEPGIFATYRFLHAPSFDLGARLRVQIITPRGGGPAGGIIEPSVPFLLHIGKLARFDAEVGIPIVATGGSTVVAPGGGVISTGATATAGLDVPLRIAFDIIEPLHVGLSTGVVIDDFKDSANSTRIPLGVFLGYAIGEKRPIVDIDPFFSFYQFLTPGLAGPGTDKVNPGIFTVGVKATGYIYL